MRTPVECVAGVVNDTDAPNEPSTNSRRTPELTVAAQWNHVPDAGIEFAAVEATVEDPSYRLNDLSDALVNSIHETLKAPVPRKSISVLFPLLVLCRAHPSTHQSPPARSSSEANAIDRTSPVPSNCADAPPNWLCPVSTCAFPPAVTVRAYLLASVNVVDASLPSQCSSSATLSKSASTATAYPVQPIVALRISTGPPDTMLRVFSTILPLTATVPASAGSARCTSPSLSQNSA